MTALLFVALGWVGSSVLIVLYLLRVAKVEVEQASSKSPKVDHAWPGEDTGRPTHDTGLLANRTVARQGAEARLGAVPEAKVLVEA
jgi:hypothetical protein